MIGLIWGILQHILIDNALLVSGVAGGILLALFAPPRLKEYGIGLAAVCVICFLVFNDGVSKGKADVQRRWDAAEAAALALGEDAHARAEAAIPPVVEPPPIAAPPAAAKSTGSKPSRVPACKPTSRYDRCK